MSTSAIVMMIVAIVVVWGGLVVSSIYLARKPLASGPHPHDEHNFEVDPKE